VKDWLISLVAAIALVALVLWCAFIITPLVKVVLG
jgi:hypothetical protein